ncbi:tyrosine-type recombinase/integrase [Sphingomonas sp. H39-1-10]|uniref:tyrosine-type recombinase/integrase n=1 Tax=Sphingomonas pollutisoli TaxID=3030829 RepID=UPI0023B8AA58|nr:tyrosine-type recombinase/integrase [Sphingomonas pollutisoli]MDF0491174.1 tyrosine-type recombinase/integrase [Sphingomonas pollutisoli]
MRVKLNGVLKVRKKLASGRTTTYYYAWRGGPRLEGSPGSREFHKSYFAAHEKPIVKPAVEVLNSIFDAFLISSDYTQLADRTQKDYKKHLVHIRAEFGDLPVAALEDRRTRGEFLAWRDRVGQASQRTADYRFSILARIIAWALDRGLVTANPCKRPGRLYRGSRAEFIWREAEEASFYAKAPEHLHLALKLAIWTGQRQGDLIELLWSAYTGTHIRVAQNKTKSKSGKRTLKRVLIPVGAPLKASLDALKGKYEAEGKPLPETILVTMRGTAWTSDGFRTSWRKGCAKAGVAGLTFHDLRGTVVTRLAIAGASVPQIATITGHSLRDVEAILDAHYLLRDGAMANSAIALLETKEPA